MRCTAFIAITDWDVYRWVEAVTTAAEVVSGSGATALDASAAAGGVAATAFFAAGTHSMIRTSPPTDSMGATPVRA